MSLYDTTSPLKQERNLKDDLLLLAKTNPKKLINLLKHERIARLKAEELSEIDDITELLLNRRGWKKYATACVYELAQKNEPFCIFFIDLDRLKAVDDTFTNQHGTVYIQLFAQVLHDTLRSSDIKSHPHGDEFFVLLPNINFQKAKEIRKKLNFNFRALLEALPEDHYFYEVPKKCDIGASIGIDYKAWTLKERELILSGSRFEAEGELQSIVRATRIKAGEDTARIKKKKKIIRDEARKRSKMAFLSQRLRFFRPKLV